MVSSVDSLAYNNYDGRCECWSCGCQQTAGHRSSPTGILLHKRMNCALVLLCLNFFNIMTVARIQTVAEARKCPGRAL